MSDKLSDEQIEAAKAAGFSWHPIWQCLVVRHSNGAWTEVSDKLARFAALLAASPAPAIHMPPLNDAMRAVLTNENCVYGTPDELYAALGRAAPAIPAEVATHEPLSSKGSAAISDAQVADHYAPAISESEDALLTAARRAIPALAHAAERNPAYQRDYEELSKAIEDAARKGGGS
ncbi:hypothetical protein [Burkholderia gladioli]|uniref:hypothetical protein n=1 Tax=Burkholderia gladioli TaxID=28095 RepID=UPI00163F4CE2|nr:hypothetical protein [Burkholderia gladioli]